MTAKLPFSVWMRVCRISGTRASSSECGHSTVGTEHRVVRGIGGVSLGQSAGKAVDFSPIADRGRRWQDQERSCPGVVSQCGRPEAEPSVRDCV